MPDGQDVRALNNQPDHHPFPEVPSRVIGILQGRLTRPWNGELQCFPRDGWEEEFFLARRCGFNAIELIAEASHNPANPIWSDDGRRRIRELSQQTGVRATTLCADCFMSVTFSRAPEASVELLAKLIGCGFERIVVPFIGAANLASIQEAKQAFARVSALAGHGVELAVESALPADALRSSLEGKPLGVCYDLGNTTALGYDIVHEIHTLGSRIPHVHVKDKRRSDGQNVILGTGDTDLVGAFAALRAIGFAGEFTLETNRGNDPVETASAHLKLVEDLLR